MKKILIVAFSLFVVAALAGIVVLHEPPLTYPVGEDIILRLEVQDGLDTIKQINLCYKPAEAQDYTSSKMQAQATGSNIFEAEVKHKEAGDTDLVYYFEITLADDQVQRYPEELEGGLPFYIKAEEVAGKEEMGFILLSTENDFTQEDGYILAVSYITLADRIDPGSIQVWVNGKEVTKKSVITRNTLIYKEKTVKNSTYKAVISALSTDGVKLRSQTFITKVSNKKIKTPLELMGKLNIAVDVYGNNEESGLTPTGYEDPNNDIAGWLDLYAKYGKLRMNTNLYVSTLENENLQPVNRYRIGLDLPSLSIQAGDYSPHLSSLVMSNRNIRGLYGKLYGKYIGLEVSAGEMVRQTEGVDILNDSAQTVTAFSQEAIGARLRLGTEEGLSWSFNAARNRDIISSLDESQFIEYDPVTLDTLFIVAPQDNAVVSSDLKLNIPGLRTSIGAEVAGSLLNRNTWFGPISTAEIQQYISGFDYVDPADVAELFVINRNMEPLIPGINNCAANAYLRSLILNNLINVNYTVTGPVFNALSTSGQKQDTKVLNISDMFNIGRSIFLTGGYNTLEDNFSQTASETNLNKNWFVQSSLRFFKVINLRAGYFNSDSENTDNPKIVDGAIFIPYQRNSHSLNVGLGYYSQQSNIIPYQADITYRTGADDSTLSTIPDYENSSNSISFSMSNKLKQIPLRTQFVLTIASQEQDQDPVDPANDLVNNGNVTFFAKASYPLLQSKLIPFLHYRFVNLSGDQDDQSYNYLTFGLEAYPLRNMNISTDISTQSYKNKDDSSLNGKSLIWRLTFGQRF